MSSNADPATVSPPAALDPASIIAAAKTFRDAVRTFDQLVRKRPAEDRGRSWPPQDTLPVGAAATALRRTLTPSDPDRWASGDYYVDVPCSGNLTPAARLLLREVWWNIGFVEEDARRPDDGSLALNLNADEWDVLLENVAAVLVPRPRWDDDNRTLHWRGVPIKTYKRAGAPNQTEILRAFEKEGWPSVILDPFNNPTVLSQTLKDLKLTLPSGNIFITGDGDRGVRWDPAPAS
jgi:hypothetical protein